MSFRLEDARAWLRPSPAYSRASFDLIRVTVALVLLTHPLYALTHPDSMHALGRSLASPGFPPGLAIAWVTTIVQVALSAMLLARRFVVPASAAYAVILAMGILLFFAPRWYVVGGAEELGYPGSEFNVLLILCLGAVAWADRAARPGDARGPGAPSETVGGTRALDLVRLAAALFVCAHSLHPFFDWNVEGMREWGEGMSRLGFPFGVQLVWFVVLFQTACSCALVSRRLVVPACLGHVTVLGVGIKTSHAPHWFVVGPGEEGAEYSVVLIACFLAVLVAHWPRPFSRPTWLSGFRFRPTHPSH